MRAEPGCGRLAFGPGERARLDLKDEAANALIPARKYRLHGLRPEPPAPAPAALLTFHANANIPVRIFRPLQVGEGLLFRGQRRSQVAGLQ